MLKKWVWVTVLSAIGIVALGFGGWALIDHYQYSQLVDQPSDVKNGKLIRGRCSPKARQLSKLKLSGNQIRLKNARPPMPN